MKLQRHLPPTAAPVSGGDLIRGIFGLFGRGRAKQLEKDIGDYFGVSDVFLVSSGKAALTIILQALKKNSTRKTVLIPAYTCFSVPSAVLKAGLNVALCDVDPQTLDYDLDQLQGKIGADTLGVVAPHLLGRPANISAIQALAEANGVAVIEDAAQAMGGMSGARFLGTQTEVGFFSVGRGKNVSAGSGGIIVTKSEAIGTEVRKIYEHLPEDPLSSMVSTLLSVVATKAMLHPNAYWFPAGLPFLGLGETVFYSDFPIHRMNRIQVALLSSWRFRLQRSNQARLAVAHRFAARLSRDGISISLPDPVPWLRFPVLMRSAMEKRALCEIGRANGLGISALYPAPVNEIKQLRGCFPEDYPGAKSLAERLVTLPTHGYVQDRDIERISAALSASDQVI